MFEYPKTENVFTRDETTKRLNLFDFRFPEFALIDKWHISEKIDGTNMRVIYDPLNKTVDIRGRTDKANLFPGTKECIEALFTLESLQNQFDEYLGEENIANGTKVTIFGEAYGAGINKGGNYSAQKRFAVFDIVYNRPKRNSWCQPSTVEMICKNSNWPIVPNYSLDKWTFNISAVVQIVQHMKEGKVGIWMSIVSEQEMIVPEGVVARTDPYLYNEKGERIMWKLKVRDLPD